MLTAKDSIEDRVTGLDVGLDTGDGEIETRSRDRFGQRYTATSARNAWGDGWRATRTAQSEALIVSLCETMGR